MSPDDFIVQRAKRIPAEGGGAYIWIGVPAPPSANRWWRKWRGRMVLSAAAREYKELFWAAAKRARITPIPKDTAVCVSLWWYRARKSGDLDKRLGIVLDAMQGTVYETDAQIARIDATRRDMKPVPHEMVIHVAPFVA